MTRLADQPPLLYHVDKKILNPETLAAFFRSYLSTLPEERPMLFDRFTPVNLALKVVGVGSVGTRCAVCLLLAAPDDPLILQVKEARSLVLEPFVKGSRAAHYSQRVVIGQRLMQSASDIFLGWAKGSGGRDFYVRQVRDMKVSADIEGQPPRIARYYAMLCGRALPRAHDKAGDAAMIAGYLGSKDQFDEAIGDYAVAYAYQVERDYGAFVKAIWAGKLKTDTSWSKLATMLR